MSNDVDPLLRKDGKFVDETVDWIVPMPKGVNFASWLSLEDYFFVGDRGAIEVASAGDKPPVAQCLPPLHTGTQTGPAWYSETDLFMNLTSSMGVAYAIRTFDAFRRNYIDLENDLKYLQQLGIRRVRVPVSWCWTEHDPSQDVLLDQDISEHGKAENDHEHILLERYACKDPLFQKHDNSTVYWPAVPRGLVTELLRACGRYNIKATLDIHTYAGGTSLGTFSGIWPRSPVFWYYDDPEHASEDWGRQTFTSILEWIQNLSESDPEAFQGLGAITPMNEPAHLAGLFAPGGPWESWGTSFLPPLPDDLAKSYLNELKSSKKGLLSVPDGPHLRVLLWQRDAIELFRRSSLPSKGIELQVNIHESILGPTLAPGDGDQPGGLNPQSVAIVAAWWRETTTPEERSQWAVLDMHHYHAWTAACQGTVDGHASYTCGNRKQTESVLKLCSSWSNMYRAVVDEQLGEIGAKLCSGEFSSSTHHTVLRSCTDLTTLRLIYYWQVAAGDDSNIDLYYWAWKMPYGGAFRAAWSFQQLMYLFDRNSKTTEFSRTVASNQSTSASSSIAFHPDLSLIPCGEK
jgi:hypothetical protein